MYRRSVREAQRIKKLIISQTMIHFKKIQGVKLDDDESIFNVFSFIIDTILTERLEDETNENNEGYKVMLHFKLNIIGYNNSILNLKDFLLLFGNNEKFDSDKKAVISVMRRNNNQIKLKPYIFEYYCKMYLRDNN